MTYDAFISYRRSDRITADGIARFLDAFGLKVFVDRSSRAGAQWEPELRAALAEAKVLVVLWSRSAAQSAWVECEWQNVSPACRVVPLKLDGEALPDELNRLTAVEGLDVGSRLLQRSFELMQQGRLSPAQAQAQLVKELAADGVVLEPKKREALAIFLSFVSGLAAAVATTQFGSGEASPRKDSLPASSATTPPPPVGGRKLASLLSGLGLSGAAAFGVGYWAAPRDAAPPVVQAESSIAPSTSATPPMTCAPVESSAPCPSAATDASSRPPPLRTPPSVRRPPPSPSTPAATSSTKPTSPATGAPTPAPASTRAKRTVASTFATAVPAATSSAPSTQLR